MPEQASIDAEHAAMLSLLADLQGDSNGAFYRLDAATASAARDLGNAGLSGSDADMILSSLAASGPAAISAITFDRDGTVRAAAPASVTELIGLDLSGQQVVQAVLTQNQPLQSDLFALAEGGYAATIEYPVISPEGQVIGAVSGAFSPYELVRSSAETTLEDTPYAVMAVQRDGLVLFDSDPARVGTAMVDESLSADSPEMLDFAGQCSAYWSGYAMYSFPDTGTGQIVKKEAYWTTIGIHRNEWRLIIIREI
ncbi:MAG: hypothetical protein GKC04_05605 [Methanomicrobiales archaeon]|nr:hypothetical protein [Methanomicrobiales archaeon]